MLDSGNPPSDCFSPCQRTVRSTSTPPSRPTSASLSSSSSSRSSFSWSIAVVQARRIGRLGRRLDGLTRGADGRSLEAVLDAHLDKVFSVAREVDDLSARSAVLEANGRRAVQRMGLVRFNPFEETGGNQSFALGVDRRERRRVRHQQPPRPGRHAPVREGGRGRPVRCGPVGGGRTGAPAGTRGTGRAVVQRPASRRGRRSDSQGVTSGPEDPDMPPDRPDTDTPMTRPRGRREPTPLEQIPVWDGFVADAPSATGRRRSAGRPRRAARRPQPGAAQGGDARRGAAARRRRRRYRQDPGHHAPHRLADRDPPRATLGDPGADVHGEGRGGDAGPGGSARPVRLHGCVDRDVPRVRRPDHPRVRPRARPADGRPRPEPPGGRDLPPRAPVRVRARRVPAARRPDAVPRRARDALQPVQGRGRLAGGVPRPRRRARDPVRRGTGRRGARGGRAPPGRAGPGLRSLPGAARGGRLHRLRRPGQPRPSARRGRRRRLGRSCDRGSGTSSWTSSRTRTAPSRSSSRSWPSRTATSRSSATTTSRSTSSAARRSATSSASASGTGRRGPSSCAATTARWRRSSTRRTASSGSTTRTASRSGPGSPSSSVPVRSSRGRAARARRGVRDARRGGGLDRRARSARRVAAGARPRDHAVLVRANGHADPILRSLNVAGIPWRFSGTSGLYARPEVRRLLAFLRAVADPTSSVDVYALAAERAVRPRRRGPHRDRQHRPGGGIAASGRSSRSSTGSRGSCACRRRRARRRAASSADLRRYSELAHERPAGEVLYTFLRDAGLARPARGQRLGGRPRRPSGTSPGSSTSSAASRRSSPTIGRSSWPGTWTRSSRPATTRRPRTSIRTPTPSRC